MSDYDLILPGIFLGNIYSTRDEKFLKLNNIGYILSITNNYIQVNKNKYKTLHLKLSDNPFTDIISYFDSTNRFIDEAVRKKIPIYIHCDMGISRSSSFLSAYLIYKYGKNFDSVYNFIKRKRDVVYPNYGFQAQLKLYEKLIGNENNKAYYELFSRFIKRNKETNELYFNVEKYLDFLGKFDKMTYLRVKSGNSGKYYTDNKGITYNKKGKYY